MLAITAVVNLIARRINLPSPIVLVVAGAMLAVMPGLPRIALPPDLVLLVLLPPLIYYAAFAMSWQAFCQHLRPILLLAVGCVVFTTITVAAAAHWLDRPCLASRIRARRDRFATRCGGAARDCAQTRSTKPHHRSVGRRRPGQRCDRTRAVQVRAGRGTDRRRFRSHTRR